MAYPVKLQRQRVTSDNLGRNTQQGKLYKRHIRRDRIDIDAADKHLSGWVQPGFNQAFCVSDRRMFFRPATGECFSAG